MYLFLGNTDYCNVFISYLDCHSDGTHTLLSIMVCNRCNAKFLKIRSYDENKLYILECLRMQLFIFGKTIPLRFACLHCMP